MRVGYNSRERARESLAEAQRTEGLGLRLFAQL